MKIFVTVGAQMPFDRLVLAVDNWVQSNPDIEAYAQVGPGGYRPRNMEYVEFVGPEEYKRLVDQSTLIISHAGMGSIITALQYGKPLIVVPRKGSLLETRNDHQSTTVDRFRHFDGIFVATDESKIGDLLDSVSDNPLPASISQFASDRLIDTIKVFINS